MFCCAALCRVPRSSESHHGALWGGALQYCPNQESSLVQQAAVSQVCSGWERDSTGAGCDCKAWFATARKHCALHPSNSLSPAAWHCPGTDAYTLYFHITPHQCTHPASPLIQAQSTLPCPAPPCPAIGWMLSNWCSRLLRQLGMSSFVPWCNGHRQAHLLWLHLTRVPRRDSRVEHCHLPHITLLFLIEVSGLCTCSPSSGFLWNGTGENWKQFIYYLLT